MNKALCIAATLLIALSYGQRFARAQVAGDAVESIQIRSIDFDTQVLELYNFGAGTQPLDGWRFCSHDELDGFDYTSSNGLDGQSIASGDSLFIHWNNDAVGPDALNIADLGGAAVDDLTSNSAGSAVSIGLFRTAPFGSSDNLVDHIQYSFGGADVGGATPRGGVAEGADLWTLPTDWIAVDAASTSVFLSADPFPGAGAAHGPGSYTVIPEPTTAVLGAIAAATCLLRRKK